MKIYEFIKEDIERYWPYYMEFFVDILNGRYDLQEARKDLRSLIGSKYDDRIKKIEICIQYEVRGIEGETRYGFCNLSQKAEDCFGSQNYYAMKCPCNKKGKIEENGMYVIRRKLDNRYLSRPGLVATHSQYLELARIFRTISSAEDVVAENEYIQALEDILWINDR